jgi:sugar phosphate isomerase/epimerase
MQRPLLHRRTFAQALALTAGLSIASGGYRATQAAQRPRLKLGLQLYSLRNFPIDQALQHAKDLGFQQVEFYSGMLPIQSTAQELDRVKSKVAGLGMSISAHGVNRFSKDEAANRKLFEFAKALGIPTITADPDPDSFSNLDALVKEFDIRVAIHNHGPTHRYNKVVDVLRAIESHDVRIGACADLGHFIRSSEKPEDVIRALKGRLYGVHLKDFAEMTNKTKGVILGKGHLDCLKVFTALTETQFPENGALSLEYEENEKDPIADIRECVRVAREGLDKIPA